VYLARIDGTLTATAKHPSFEGWRLLLGQRIEPDGTAGGEPLVILDRLGARRGSLVVVSTDGDLTRRELGDDTTPSRLMVVGLVDQVHLADAAPAPGERR
jgi:ethanolamine utilization protein EutN